MLLAKAVVWVVRPMHLRTGKKESGDAGFFLFVLFILISELNILF